MRFIRTASLFLLVMAASRNVVSGQENVPGIAAEKPAEGPSVKVEGGFMVPYTIQVPGSHVKIDMVPVPGGTFKLGSSEDAVGFQEDEGPQVEIEVGPMWVAKYETTWQQYELYMSMYKLFKDLQSQGLRKYSEDRKVDAVTAPTELYEPTFTYKYGQEPKLPAVTMTQYSAKQYTKWLSKLTGQQYRLPTEAEWEYACRAGSETEYSFGDDVDDLDDYGWYFDNSDERPQTVGQKKPNAFGLHDMHGNVMEWVVDGYTEDGYAAVADKGAKNALDAIQWPTEAAARVVRGGSFEDDGEKLRSAARLSTEGEDWKTEDPNVPLSPWWFTDDPTRGIGFRIFRSYQALDDSTITKFWEIDHEDIQFDVDMRLDEGRGVITPVDPDLSKDIEAQK